MSQTNWEADKMLDIYIYDYLMKRKLHTVAKAFQAEGKVPTDPVAIDAPGGFLFEWWSVFWDIFIARTNEKHSEAAASYLETQTLRAREQQQQQQKPQPHQHIPMPQATLQRQGQQQQPREDSNSIQHGVSGNFTGNDNHMRQNAATSNTLAAKTYEERLNHSLQRDQVVVDDSLRQRLSGDMDQTLDQNQTSVLKAAATGGQAPVQTPHGSSGAISSSLQQAQMRSQRHPVSAQDAKNQINSLMTPRAGAPDGLLIGLQGANQSSGNLTLRGWPLTGLDQLKSGLLQQHRSSGSSQPINQLQLQHQLMLQAQRNMASSPNDLEVRKLKMLLNNQNSGLAKDISLNSVGEVVPNAGSAMHTGCPPLPPGDSDMLFKLQQQQLLNSNQQQANYQQDQLSIQHSQNSSPLLHQPDKSNIDASKSQMGRKRKQPASSSGAANSSGTGNTTGPSLSLPSSPSTTQTPGDIASRPTLPATNVTSKSMLMYGPENGGSLPSAAERFVDDGAFDDNVDSYLTHEDGEPGDSASCGIGKGFTFTEIQHINASTSKLECCHFSSDGKLLATGGHDKKAVLWSTDTFAMKSTFEEHVQYITDVRFSPSISRLATSSADKTVRVWDAENPGYSLRTFTGHTTTVMSLDFHPSNEDLLCSCDNNSEIRYWSIKNGSCAGIFKGGATQTRFQPRAGRTLAAASDDCISILDVETLVCRRKLQGHKGTVHSICWDASGEYLASVSNDAVRVWSIGSGTKGECIHELNRKRNNFQTCVFHPTYTSLLIIGSHESLELWDMAENKTMSLRGHDETVSALAVSTVAGIVASASHDKFVKIWK